MGFIIFLIIGCVFFMIFFKQQKEKKQKQIESDNQFKIYQEAQDLKNQRIQFNLRLVKKNLIDISNQNNYYELLSVSPNATSLEIRTAFYEKISNLILPQDKDSKLLYIQALMVLTDYFIIDFFDLSFKDDFFNHINDIATCEENDRKTKKNAAEQTYKNSNRYFSDNDNNNALKQLKKARDEFYSTRPSSIMMHSYVPAEPLFQLFDSHLIFNKSFRDLHDEHLNITQGYSKASTSVLLSAIKSKYNFIFNDFESYSRLKNPIIKMGYLYLAEQKNHLTPENTYLCKIGLTTTADPHKRVRSQQTVDLEVIYTAHFESIYEVEDILHALYKKLDKHYSKEYFYLSSDDIHWIKTLGSQDTYALSEERKKEKEARLQKKQNAYKKYKRYSTYKRY
jgi:hypothetical protein